MIFLLDRILKHFISAGALDVILPDGSKRHYKGRQPGPSATIHVRTDKALKALMLNSGLAFGEGWMDGDIVAVDCTLEDVLGVLMLNIQDNHHLLNRIEEKARFVTRFFRQWNSQRRSRRNVAHHYDLNGALYDLFLDEDRQYSCAYFTSDDMSLEEAQRAKKHHIAAKLLLDRPGLEVLDIGCGWGGMALTLAKEYGAKVTGITLSQEQLQVARERARAAGLEGQVQFQLLDYRKLNRSFDRIVSVGMFEHVGIGQYDTFFRTVRRVLKPDGVALIHSIGRMDGPGSTNPWINKYIFPGGYSPALSEVIPSVERAGLWVADCEILRLHYAKTIKLWRERFAANREKIKALYDERFCRMFEFYLVGAELSFRLQGHMNFQLQLTPDINAVPLTRDYLCREG
ncbi:class I SAM-dependent methyltransferase [Asaia lannensis]|uniref:Cyclopropane-fatty-acyl-phospholipid synthase family protein n=1 Tax=Asaia lannensis NBRC 102526 TaxID=1307926 RepID=A0ABT1CGD6_9PROT|nr:cyclopropane-fatty-acyl-phospholipid synthase family protein [Asaia lannensis]MCO6159279.1 cyclopropane-fatty-acyl-phospholipid synthase family protein [Asaia lannensis NBRC 102526]GBQ97408.1 cyclopropane-fatty-acyl-phospholipid synthase [Asaia lannensis NBRC 102526]